MNLKGLDPKIHRGVIQLLQLHYVESGRLSAETAVGLAQLETYRELSDYNTQAEFDENRASEEIHRAESFIAGGRPLLPPEASPPQPD